MVLFVAEDKAFIPNNEPDHQNGGKKMKGKFREPPFDILPPVLRIIIFKISQPGDEGEPDDIVLSDDEAQDSEEAGEPETPFQGK